MATIDAIVVSERESMARALPALRAAVAEVRGLKRHDFEAFCTIARKAACPQVGGRARLGVVVRVGRFGFGKARVREGVVVPW